MKINVTTMDGHQTVIEKVSRTHVDRDSGILYVYGPNPKPRPVTKWWHWNAPGYCEEVRLAVFKEWITWVRY